MNIPALTIKVRCVRQALDKALDRMLWTVVIVVAGFELGNFCANVWSWIW